MAFFCPTLYDGASIISEKAVWLVTINCSALDPGSLGSLQPLPGQYVPVTLHFSKMKVSIQPSFFTVQHSVILVEI